MQSSCGQHEKLFKNKSFEQKHTQTTFLLISLDERATLVHSSTAWKFKLTVKVVSCLI